MDLCEGKINVSSCEVVHLDGDGPEGTAMLGFRDLCRTDVYIYIHVSSIWNHIRILSCGLECVADVW